MTLSFVQIYYKDEHLPHLYPFATPYKNEKLSPYFENQVISELVPTIEADLIGVASWRLKEKRNESSTPFILTKAYGDTLLTEERILSHKFDVAVLTPRNNLHQPLAMASNWHGKAWDDAFVVLKRYLYNQHRIKVPDELTHTIYENHFVAKGDIYREYVATCLSPTIDFISNEETGVFMVDAGYAKRKREHEAKAYQEVSGRKDWPIAPFILERLFMIWIENKKFKVIPL